MRKMEMTSGTKMEKAAMAPVEVSMICTIFIRPIRDTKKHMIIKPMAMIKTFSFCPTASLFQSLIKRAAMLKAKVGPVVITAIKITTQ